MKSCFVFACMMSVVYAMVPQGASTDLSQSPTLSTTFIPSALESPTEPTDAIEPIACIPAIINSRLAYNHNLLITIAKINELQHDIMHLSTPLGKSNAEQKRIRKNRLDSTHTELENLKRNLGLPNRLFNHPEFLTRLPESINVDIEKYQYLYFWYQNIIHHAENKMHELDDFYHFLVTCQEIGSAETYRVLPHDFCEELYLKTMMHIIAPYCSEKWRLFNKWYIFKKEITKNALLVSPDIKSKEPPSMTQFCEFLGVTLFGHSVKKITALFSELKIDEGAQWIDLFYGISDFRDSMNRYKDVDYSDNAAIANFIYVLKQHYDLKRVQTNIQEIIDVANPTAETMTLPVVLKLFQQDLQQDILEQEALLDTLQSSIVETSRTLSKKFPMEPSPFLSEKPVSEDALSAEALSDEALIALFKDATPFETSPQKSPKKNKKSPQKSSPTTKIISQDPIRETHDGTVKHETPQATIAMSNRSLSAVHKKTARKSAESGIQERGFFYAHQHALRQILDTGSVFLDILAGVEYQLTQAGFVAKYFVTKGNPGTYTFFLKGHSIVELIAITGLADLNCREHFKQTFVHLGIL